MRNQHWLKTYKSLISLSVEGFKFSAFANGCAAVALLAYLGNIAGKGASVPAMRLPMALFLMGICACGLAMLFAYLAQLKLLNEVGRSEKSTASHAWFLWVAVLFFTLSLIAFGVGSWQAVVHFH